MRGSKLTKQISLTWGLLEMPVDLRMQVKPPPKSELGLTQIGSCSEIMGLVCLTRGMEFINVSASYIFQCL